MSTVPAPRPAADVDTHQLADYQKAMRLILRHPLVTEVYPDPGALPLVRRFAPQLRRDLADAFDYRLLLTYGTARLLRAQDGLDTTRPALTRTGRPFDRRRYALLALTLSALGRAGTQVVLGELADAVAAEAGQVDGLGMDTGRKADRDAFVDAVTFLTGRGALRMADGSAADWVSDPDKAEALYDIDREVVDALFRPGRVLQHLESVTGLLAAAGAGMLSQGREAQRRQASRAARRLVVERPAVYYADVDPALHGQLRAPALAQDVERLTGLTLERRAEGVALVDPARRMTDLAFPAGGTVAQAALLLAVRIAQYVQGPARSRIEHLPHASAAERLAQAAARLDAALPARPAAAEQLLAETEAEQLLAGTEDDTAPPPPGEAPDTDEARYPFVTEAWLRRALKALVDEFGAGMSATHLADRDRLLDEALALLAAMSLVARVDGGVLALPLLARYRGARAEVKTARRAAPRPSAQETLSTPEADPLADSLTDSLTDSKDGSA
ncbi:TIGR02678 family protein [Streptomyces sp. NPDC018000]|uniref:TIGR02678 family protein n=1 Tax=Streptomyces sp. NPDC018000 TaxID=3365028 RepID=UPI0037A4F9D6